MKNNTRKITAVLTAMLMALLIPVSAFATGFKDVKSYHWAYSYIMEAQKSGLVAGYPDGTFRPSGNITVAEMASLCANIIHMRRIDQYGEDNYWNEENGTGYWAAAAIQYCKDASVFINEYVDMDITAENYSVPCSRFIAAMMFKRAAQGFWKDYQSPARIDHTLQRSYVPDLNEVPADYQMAVLEMYKYGVITGVDNAHTFNPNANITRAEIATLLNTGCILESSRTITTEDLAPGLDELPGTDISAPPPDLGPSISNPGWEDEPSIGY